MVSAVNITTLLPLSGIQCCVPNMQLLYLKVGYGICEMPAVFENTQLKCSHPLSFNADPDSTHSKYMDAESCTSKHRCARASHLLVS